jgi:hypothetical protein
VTTLDWSENDNNVDLFLRRLFPQNLCSAELLRESEQKLAGAQNLIPLARRAWLEANDELGKCIAIRARAGL